MADEPVVIKLDTKHAGFQVNRWLYNSITILRFLINITVIVWTTQMFYRECLFNPNVNPIVVTYFSLISFSCILNLGIPIDKLANISLKS